MSIINLSIGELIEDCPDITIQDTSDYSEADFFVNSDFKFHDYGTGLPSLNSTISYNTFVFGPTAFTGVSIDIETDGVGNIINPEAQYIALASELNASAPSNIQVELIQLPDTGYRDWYLRISTDVDEFYAGATTSVADSGGTVTPIFTTISGSLITGGTQIESRNITLKDKDGCVIDLGAVAQQDELVLSGTYTETETFSLDFCGDIVAYEVTSENTAECVAAGIEAAIIAKLGGLFESYVSVVRDDSLLTFISKEAGVPLQIDVTYSGAETFGSSTTIASVPSMLVPSYTNSDEIVYQTSERGGQYEAILTVVSVCDYNVSTREFFSWCYDLNEFDCCFVSLVKNGGCCCKTTGKKLEIGMLRNIIQVTGLMITKGESESSIQKVVDMGWSICQPLTCGCATC